MLFPGELPEAKEMREGDRWMNEPFRLEELHNHEELLDDTVHLLNSQWPRSESSRKSALQRSCDAFPTSLVLITADNQVVGHGSLLKVDNKPDALLLESVVVDNKWRGKGIGRILMQETLNYAKKKGFCEIYLATKDKQAFYAHLGFTECDPVTSLGANSKLLSPDQLSGLLNIFGGNTSPREPTELQQLQEILPLKQQNKQDAPPPPLPPPPPPQSRSQSQDTTWMKKQL